VDPHSCDRDGPCFVSGARDGMISMWTAEGDCLQSTGAHRNAVNCMSEFQSYDNNVNPSVCSNPCFVSSGGDGLVKVWDSRRLRVASSFSAQNIVKVAWFHHCVVTGSSSGAVTCWDQGRGGEDSFPPAPDAVGEQVSPVWSPQEIGALSQAVTDLVSDKYCVASASKSGQILRWGVRS
jgi:WD40 repeat protein